MAQRRSAPINAPMTEAAKAEDVTITGDWTFTGTTTVGGITDTNLLDKTAAEVITGAYDFTVANAAPSAGSKLSTDMLYLDAKEAIDGNDTFLRLNENGDFSAGVYTPNDLRADGTFTFANQTCSASSVTLNLSPSGNINMTPGGNVQILSGNRIRTYDSGNTDYIDVYHTGTVGRIDCNSGPIQFDSDINITELNDLRLACSVGTVQSTSARIKGELQTLADDATGTFMTSNNSSYRLHILVSSYNATAAAMWFQTTTQAPQVIFQGSNVSIAATVNPDVDTDVNIWHSSSTEVSIKNRLGSSRTFTLYSIGL